MMRCFCMVLIAAALFGCGHAIRTARGSTLTNLDQKDIPTTRVLRFRTTSTDSKEERGFFTTWINTAVPKLLVTDNQLEHLTVPTTSVNEVFKNLQLNKLDHGLDEVLLNPSLKRFGNYLIEIRSKNPPEALIGTLSKHYGEDTVAKMLFDAKYVTNTEDIAKHLQAVQFIKWFNEKKTPTDVWNLLQLTHKTAYENPYHAIWWEYVAVGADIISRLKI
ncbi:Putative RxLR effector [Phytophthora palmivora]|uniref:RxLR effector n=1 Tax=Phytophthora palmivora TaxID=4796 RepID=A0A2P4XKA4_9STRA|nr:Putative RxLR effector [Phytophthora palmivora]